MTGAGQTESGSGRRRTVLGLAALGLAVLDVVLFAVLAFHVLIDYTRHWDYNVVRLGRTFALAAGEPLYPPRESGVVLNSIYGPVGALAYVPATLFRDPGTAVLFGQTVSLLLIFLPLAWLHARDSIRGRGLDLPPVFGFLLFAALAIDFKPLEYVTFSIHVDAPALGLSLLACGVLMGERAGAGDRRRRYRLASVLAVLAVWSKLMVLPILVALPLWVYLADGRSRALELARTLALTAAGVSALMVIVFGPIESLLFNMWTLPAWQTLGEAHDPDRWRRVFVNLTVESWTVYLLWMTAALLYLRRAAGRCEGTRWIRDPLWSYGLVGLCLVPMMVMGMLKRGGDINPMAFVAIFLIAGATLSLARMARDSAPLRRALVAAPTGLLVVVLVLQEPEAWRTLKDPFPARSVPHRTAFDYATAHPGEIYFPRMTLVHLLAEGKAYHQVVGLIDRAFAGIPVTDEHLRAHVPPRMRGIALYDNMFSGEISFYEDLGFSRPTRDPELPGFEIWERP